MGVDYHVLLFGESMATNEFVDVLIAEIDGKIRNATLGYSQGNKLVLGGTGGAGGGSGCPPRGFSGKLLQTYVTYDTTEAATLSGTTASGSLLDNLNHIRYKIDNLVASGGTDANAVHTNVANEINQIDEKTVVDLADIIIIEDSIDVFSKKSITVDNLKTVVLSGYSSTNTTFGEDLTSQIPVISGVYTLSNSVVAGTLRLYINGIRQRTINYTASGYYVTLSGTLLSGDDILVDYNYADAKDTGYGEGVYGGSSYGG